MMDEGEMGERGESSEHEEAELLAILQREERTSVGYESDQIYQDQVEAFKRYTGENYGTEVPGRSQVHDRTVFEVIEWLRPDLERVFASGGRAVNVEPWGEDTAEMAEDASDYINHLFFEEMEGGQIVDALAFDGLLQKRGVGAVYWRDGELGDPQTMEGGPVELQRLQDSGAVILGVEPSEDGQSAVITYQPEKKMPRPDVKCIAPEDFRIASRSTSLERPRYCGHIERPTKSDLKLEFPDHVEKIDEYATEYDDLTEIDERRAQRFWDEDEMYKQEPASSDEAVEVRLWREYIYYDRNGDGYAELLEVFRLDGCILTVEEVDDNPYFSWTPIPIPHRWFGLSIYDIAKDIQKINTTLIRGALDSVYMSVAPRTIANNNVNLSDLLTVRPGATIRTNSNNPVGQDVQPFVTPDVSASALNMLEVMRQASEARTGVTRNAQGMDPDALNKTATGIKLMQNAASIRKEQIARNLGRGLEMMFRKIYRIVVSQQEQSRSVHMGKGRFKRFDPGQWPAEAKIRVHVGNGTGDRETQLNQLMMLLGLQREWVANFGPGNPIVGVEQLHNMVEEIGRTIGRRSVDEFFKDPLDLQQTPEGQQALQQLTAPKPDPKAEEAKAKLQMDQQKMQADQQMAAQKAQQDAAIKAQELEQKSQIDARQSEMDLAKMEREFELKQYQIEQEMQLKREQLAAELNLKRELAYEELSLKRELGIAGVAVKANGNGSSPVRPGGEPG